MGNPSVLDGYQLPPHRPRNVFGPDGVNAPTTGQPRGTEPGDTFSPRAQIGIFRGNGRVPGRRIVLALIIVARTPIQSFAGNQNQRKDELGGRPRPTHGRPGRDWPTRPGLAGPAGTGRPLAARGAAPVRVRGPFEADIGLITVTSPSLVFH